MLKTVLVNLSNIFRIKSPYITPKYFSSVQNETVQSDVDDRERKLKILALEIDVLRQEGKRAPDPNFLKQDHWDYLLTLNSRSARRKYISFLWETEIKKQNFKLKKQEKRIELEARNAVYREQAALNDHITYGLNQNTMFLRIYESTINLWHNNKLSRAMQFGQNIVMDCSYDEHMIPREAKNAAKQFMLCFAENRNHDQPFNMHFCNANMNGVAMKEFKKFVPTLEDPAFPINVHTESFMDLFPKDKLVYLTPHCRNNIEEFNHDDIYIIGGMVDKVNNEPLSLAKAKKLKIRMARLPLERYLQWGAGSGKSLTLNQMLSILLEMKSSGDWNKALSIVPRRKIVSSFPVYMEKEKRRMNRATFRIDQLEGFEKKGYSK